MTDNRTSGAQAPGNQTQGSATRNQSGQNQPGQNQSGNSGMTDKARQRAIDTYDSARETASDATRRAGDAIDEAPLIALAAGVAAGAIIAAVLPVSRQERQLMGPVGSRFTDAAREAAQTARRVAPDKLRELGLTPEAIAEKAKEAATDTAQAAAGKFRKEASGS